MSKSQRWILVVAIGLITISGLIFKQTRSSAIAVLRTGTPVFGIAFSGDGTVLITGDRKGIIYWWDVASQQPIHTIQAHTGTMYRLTLNPAGTILASVGDDTGVHLWNPNTGTALFVIPNPDRIVDIGFSPNGELLAGAGREGRVYIWSVSDGILLTTFHGHIRDGIAQGVSQVEWSPDSELLASGGGDGSVYLWRVSDGTMIQQLLDPTTRAIIRGMVFSPDGQVLIEGRDDTTIHEWSVKHGTVNQVLGKSRARVWALDMHPHEARFASAGGPVRPREEEGLIVFNKKDDTTIYLWRVGDNQPYMALKGHKETINSVAWSRDGGLLASGSDDGTIRIWRINQ